MIKRILILTYLVLFTFSLFSNEKFDELFIGTWFDSNIISAINKNDEILFFGNDDYHEINLGGEGRSFWQFLNPPKIIIDNKEIVCEYGEVEFHFNVKEIEYKQKENKYYLTAKCSEFSENDSLDILLESKENSLSFNVEKLGINFNGLIKVKSSKKVLNDFVKLRQSVIEKFGNYYSMVDNLRIREKDNTNSKVIKVLKKDEKVYVWGIGKKETINNISGRWLYVITEDKKNGYVFNGYLKEITDNWVDLSSYKTNEDINVYNLYLWRIEEINSLEKEIPVTSIITLDFIDDKNVKIINKSASGTNTYEYKYFIKDNGIFTYFKTPEIPHYIIEKKGDSWIFETSATMNNYKNFQYKKK